MCAEAGVAGEEGDEGGSRESDGMNHIRVLRAVRYFHFFGAASLQESCVHVCVVVQRVKQGGE